MPWREMGAVFYFVERRRKMWAQFSAESRLKACRVLAHHVNFKRRNVDFKRNECHAHGDAPTRRPPAGPTIRHRIADILPGHAAAAAPPAAARLTILSALLRRVGRICRPPVPRSARPYNQPAFLPNRRGHDRPRKVLSVFALLFSGHRLLRLRALRSDRVAFGSARSE